MKIFPAIDLRGGRCVRLRQGRAEDETVYSDDPVRMALSWQEQGAEFLHVVDLDAKRILFSKNITDLKDEPEGIALTPDYAYVVFHTSGEPRHSKLWRFSMQ